MSSRLHRFAVEQQLRRILGQFLSREHRARQTHLGMGIPGLLLVLAQLSQLPLGDGVIVDLTSEFDDLLVECCNAFTTSAQLSELRGLRQQGA